MISLARRSAGAILTLLFFCTAAFAQNEAVRTLDLPNPMATHTWFIIAAVGGFLLWCISYTLQLQKEALSKKKSRDDLLHRKDALLAEIADLENRHEAHQVADPQYRRDLKKLRQGLANVLQALNDRQASS